MQDLHLDAAVIQRVVLTGPVTDAELVTLYSGALCFLFPSLYEGFGLPVVEAMSCGCPVLVSNATSLPELVGAQGITLDPKEPDVWRGAVERMATDSTWRLQQRAASLARAKEFTWEHCAERTVKGYELACS